MKNKTPLLKREIDNTQFIGLVLLTGILSFLSDWSGVYFLIAFTISFFVLLLLQEE